MDKVHYSARFPEHLGSAGRVFPSGIICCNFFYLLLLFCLLQGCKSSENGEYEVLFYYTADGTSFQQGPLIEDYIFQCLDNALPDCPTFYFQDQPHDSGNWMSFPEDMGNCTEFIAVVNGPGGYVYTFIGELNQPLFEGGMRATGTYDKEIEGSIVEVGTFTATCDEITGDTGPACP